VAAGVHFTSQCTECKAASLRTSIGLIDIGRKEPEARYRATSWIDANLTESIGVDNVATAIGVGVRSLQLSFKRILGCSPHEFIMRRRLESARQMLIGASVEDSVTAIATKFDFSELGRFSQRYRDHFGETLSETLGRQGPIGTR
jgi:transcriptional regulator GlxA family with amidase domain